jgi:hypothetical protein
VPLNGDSTGRQICHENLELTVCLGRVGLPEPVFQLGKVDAAVASCNAQALRDGLPVCIGRTGRVCRI